ncbi:MAG TPA: glycosyltransferase family 9 protein [Candidatus Edwardsbacteria bacterium]|nr:glycosyltransferase family 9 protein [Candidatus Edwardsbacteria bacterium]
MAAPYRNILLVRTDRIGDVVLSLPCAALVKRALPGAAVTFLAREYTAPLVRMSPDVDGVISDDPADSALRLAAKLRRSRFDAAVLLHPTARLALALWLARIPVRVGTSFRLYSVLLNRRVAQHRRYSLKHELEHNLELAGQGLGIDHPAEAAVRTEYVPQIIVPDDLVTSSLATAKVGERRSYIVVHPGSGGSAMDWPLERFAQLIDQISSSGTGNGKWGIVVTLGPGEEPLKEKLRAHLKTEPIWVTGLSLPELAAVLSQAKLVVANSTGPLHIATAAGTRVIGLFCPVVPCHPRRWGPYGPGHAVIMPDPDKVCKECRGTECPQFDCMRSIPVSRVLEQVQRMIATS